MLRICLLLLCFFATAVSYGQLDINTPFPVQAASVEGLPIRQVIIILEKDGKQFLADSTEMEAFYKAFQLKPGANFRQSQADYSLSVIRSQAYIESASYQLYNVSVGDPVIIVVKVLFLPPGKSKSVQVKKGVIVSGKSSDFPVLYQSNTAQVSIILNGGAGLYNEVNAFFSKGPEFTNGNPVATDPAVKGTRFWGEAYLEPGISAITEIGKSKTYLYGAGTVLFTGRNTTDIFSKGGAAFAAFERLYAGWLVTGLGKQKKVNIDMSFGRQFFQLNDGFLISKYSGSANAGERGSVYLNSRTAFQKTAVLRSQINHWQLQAFFLEPQELFKDKQSNTNYAGGSVMFNNNKQIDAGISYIGLTGGSSRYATPTGSIPKKGMFIINPKLWIKDIASTGAFLKSEYAYQSHYTENMRANAWYLGLGMVKNKWKYRPSLYYRYAYMQGDDSTTQRYEKFDPMLTGGLGNWVQGINFRKIVGNGNIISHRIEAKANLNKSFEVSVDYFFLKADTRSNLGGLGPIAKLNGDNYGQEVTLTTRYFLSQHFLLLGVLSYAKPGDAIRNAFPDNVYPWTSVQLAIFMFY